MKRLFFLFIPVVFLAACGGKKTNGGDDVVKLKKERAELDAKIAKLDTKSDTSKKATPVTLQEVQPANFTATINVQSQISGDENVYAMSQSPGIVKSISVHLGQHVSRGQVLATLDDAQVQQQIQGQDVQVTLLKSIYEKQQKLWAQEIGTEVQLLMAKASYTSAVKQRDALVAQRNTFRVTAPISGVVDQMNLKIGDAMPGAAQSIRIVDNDKMKAEANLGENYLGRVQEGNPVTLLFPDLNDSIKTKLTYVAHAVDPNSRAFAVQVKLSNNSKLHPNMSCIMKIANYQNSNALVIPISVIQKTGKGEVVFVADGNKAKAVEIKSGQNSNGQVEVLSGLSAGDKIITAGFEDLDNGDPIIAQ